jgi:hypothetical protein
MRKLTALSVVITSFLILSCQKDTIKNETTNNENPALASRVKNEKTLPFKGSYSTSSEILQPAPFLKTRITGTGNSTHLGNGTFVAISTVNFTTQPPFPLGGTATFTGANGDEFYTTFTGTASPTWTGYLDIINVHTITGGTGRFQNATGGFTGYTIAFPGHTEAYIDYKGTFIY